MIEWFRILYSLLDLDLSCDITTLSTENAFINSAFLFVIEFGFVFQDINLNVTHYNISTVT